MAALKGLIRGAHDNTGLLPPGENESEDQAAQNAEAALKQRRQKLAQDKLGIAPEPVTDV